MGFTSSVVPVSLGGAALEHGGDGGPLLLHVVDVATHATRVEVVDVLHHVIGVVVVGVALHHVVVVVEVGTM